MGGSGSRQACAGRVQQQQLGLRASERARTSERVYVPLTGVRQRVAYPLLLPPLNCGCCCVQMLHQMKAAGEVKTKPLQASGGKKKGKQHGYKLALLQAAKRRQAAELLQQQQQ